MRMPKAVWVLGAGGLVGKAVVSRFADRAFVGQRYAWLDLDQIREQFAEDAGRFAEFASNRSDGSWGIVWVAGRGIVGATREDLSRETLALQMLIEVLQANRPAGAGTIFFASSAGATYAGSSGVPFTEHTQAVATSAYGEEKLAQEDVVTAAVRGGAFDAGVIGRIANVYGVGQDLAKPQGLITHLCLAAAKRTSVNLFVPLDTRRHYIDARDVAAQVEESLDAAAGEGAGSCRVKIITSGESITVGEVVRTVRRVARRPVRVATGLDARAPLQASDLRLHSVVWPEIGTGESVGLPVGVYGVMRDIDARFASGSLADGTH
jgi:UDP-glucose 4-epimerase